MAETKMIVKDLGEVTAYAYAASKGYAGTEEEFATLMASYATVGQQTADAKNAAVTARNEAEAAKNESVAAKDEAVQAAGDAAKDAKDTIDQILSDVRDNIEQIDQNALDIADLKETTEDLEDRKANIDGSYPDMTVGNAEQLNSSKYVENSEPYTLRTSGGTSDIGNREYLDSVVGGTVAWNQMVRDEASENSTDFASIVTVTDAVEDAAGVKVKIEPVQDLHGYDYPWPAGGGNQLIPINTDGTDSSHGLTIRISADGVISFSGTTDAPTSLTVKQFVLPAGEYAFSRSGSTISITGEGYFYAYICDLDNATTLVSFTQMSPDELRTFTLSRETNVRYYFVVSEPGMTVSGLFKGFLRKSSVTSMAYEPYSNICPITGWDGVQVWDDPKYGGLIEWNQTQAANLTSRDAIHGILRTVTDDKTQLRISGTCEKTDNYTVSFPNSGVNGHKYLLTLGNVELPSGARILDSVNDRTTTNIIEKTQSIFLQVNVRINKDVVIDVTVTPQCFDLTKMFGETKADEIYAMEQAEEGSGVAYFKSLFPADYYPYNAGEITTVSAVNGNPYRHYSIALPTEAGTVYGGELTVNADGSGSLVVDKGIYIPQSTDGMQIYNYQANHGALFINCLPNNLERANGLCSHSGKIGLYLDSNSVWLGVNSQNIYWIGIFDILGISTLEEFKNWLDTQTVQFVYPLTEPITYTLTPTEIRTLLGQNNVWSDAGQTALTYTGTDEHLTLESGKKYLARLSGTDSMLLGSGQEITAAKGTDNVFDLTQMFGTAVADYVYGQGAAFFRKWFPNAVYPYNAGELLSVEGPQSHDMVGFNAWDEEWELGIINSSTGENSPNNTMIRSKNHIPVVPGAGYYLNTHQNLGVARYGADKSFISFIQGVHDTILTIPNNVYFIRFYVNPAYGTTYKNDICINLAHNGSRNGEYEPYEKHSYPLDSTIILRGIPKVGANGVYWDGDRYLPDGTVERRYGVVDLGTLLWNRAATPGDGRFFARVADSVEFSPSASTTPTLICTKYNAITSREWYNKLIIGITHSSQGYSSSYTIMVYDPAYADNAAAFKAAMQGVLLVYELATPTTETAQPYHSTQWVSDWGTEEFVSTSIVPVGHETRYPANLRDKLQHLPDAASGNGSYLITQTDGQMVLTPFPAPPSTAGNYVLKATVTNGVATYTWEVAT